MLYRTYPMCAADAVQEVAHVVFNVGMQADTQYFGFRPTAEVVGFENYYAA